MQLLLDRDRKYQKNLENGYQIYWKNHVYDNIIKMPFNTAIKLINYKAKLKINR